MDILIYVLIAAALIAAAPFAAAFLLYGLFRSGWWLMRQARRGGITLRKY
jgi:hypothetical protein